IPISVSPIIDPDLFAAAQRRVDHNRTLLRRAPQRFYLLSGMIQCADCGRAYVSQAIAKNAGEPHYLYYVHRKRDGACKQGCMSARKIEERVWREVSQAILDPQRTLKGYADAREQQEVSFKRMRAHLETLQRNQIKVQQRMDKLNRMYSDPDINMTKAE
ncbi:MAG: hypothetical protein HGB05_18460, partial [Chloroflexi bacterium]|nr:hypothetical protein [Chloroflexota bacterium]